MMDIKKANLGVFAIIENSSNEFLITRNKRSPSLFELPGGGIDNDESEIETCIREVYEETTLIISEDSFTKVAFLKSRKGGPESVLYYAKILESNPIIIPCSKECSGYFWEKDLKSLIDKERLIREAGFPESISRGQFAMLNIFLYWKSLAEKKVIEGYLSSKSSFLSLENFLET